MSVTPGNGDVNSNGDKEVTLKRTDGTSLLGLALSAAALPVVLATDHALVPTQISDGINTVDVTSDGGIYTSSVIGKWLADGKLYIASDNASFSGTGFEDKVLFRNPTGSGKTIILLGFRVHLDLATTTNQLNQMNIRFHKDPTISSNGTNVGEFNLNTGAADAAVGIVTTEPTVSPRGDKVGEGIAINANYSSVFPYFMVAGSSIMVRVKMNDAANSIIYTLAWAEI